MIEGHFKLLLDVLGRAVKTSTEGRLASETAERRAALLAQEREVVAREALPWMRESAIDTAAKCGLAFAGNQLDVAAHRLAGIVADVFAEQAELLRRNREEAAR